MKLLLRLTPFILVITGLFLFGCESDDDDDSHALAGTWELTDMSQTTRFLVHEDDSSGMAAFGYVPGYVIVDTTVGWAVFNALGVNATVEVSDDGLTYEIAGTLLAPNDTLGADPVLIPGFEDAGDVDLEDDWSVIQLVGGLRTIGGALTITAGDQDAPTGLALTYPGTATSTILMVPMGTVVVPIEVLVVDESHTTLSLTKTE